MSLFHEVRLPLAVAFGASGGPRRATDIVLMSSGRESRNMRWARSRRRWEAGGAVIRADLAHELIAFFEARRGMLYGFRFRDPVDWKSCAPSQAIAATDQPLGSGDGETTQYLLKKRYASGGAVWDRDIEKPVAGAVLVAIDGVTTEAFDADPATGVVTFHAPPEDGAELTAGFEFDVPVRFDADRLEFAHEGHDAVRIVNASLAEVMG